jgi:hypothetical protein
MKYGSTSSHNKMQQYECNKQLFTSISNEILEFYAFTKIRALQEG